MTVYRCLAEALMDNRTRTITLDVHHTASMDDAARWLVDRAEHIDAQGDLAAHAAADVTADLPAAVNALEAGRGYGYEVTDGSTTPTAYRLTIRRYTPDRDKQPAPAPPNRTTRALRLEPA